MECGKLVVRSFHNSINRTSFLAHSAINTFSHINIVFSSSSWSILSWLSLNHDSISGAGSFTEFAGNASLFSGGVASESVFSSEHGGESSLLPRIHNKWIWLKGCPSSKEHWRPGKFCVDNNIIEILSNICWVNLRGNLVWLGHSDVCLIVVVLRVPGVRIVIFRISTFGIPQSYLMKRALTYHLCLLQQGRSFLVTQSPSSSNLQMILPIELNERS